MSRPNQPILFCISVGIYKKYWRVENTSFAYHMEGVCTALEQLHQNTVQVFGLLTNTSKLYTTAMASHHPLQIFFRLFLKLLNRFITGFPLNSGNKIP